ncbi:sorbosone dehydrogenase family protein [Sphingomonas sp. BIUV-7]|uniref:Sorbosone dehydrogenase family protein n=1 Tax=Sphingomonas natans TaxID=3063330 RepID=A0ABT8Y3A1_9SPHN|nr:sorbosone dehydrogenase family protein [Sphingomonas sp. BIUV-7]MDO6412788.1 sorbosone dehydrogenase family protein [Sphingomonas sp. BIUV-7]
MLKRILIVTGLIVVALAAGLYFTVRNQRARLDITAGQGTKPKLDSIHTGLIPLVHVAKAVGWKTGEMPTPAAGLKVQPFATGLDHPRWLLALPNGDVLVAESNAPPKPDDNKGLKAKVQGLVMGMAGAETKSANRITLLRDKDGDGVAESRTVLISGLNSPFGMALVGPTLYIANADAIVSVPFTPGQTRIDAKPVKLIDLPGGPINHHWTKNILASPDGKLLYVTVGSNSNVGERGMAVEQERAAIWEVDLQTKQHRIFAYGLRNPNGMAWEPTRKVLYTVVNERDELGSDVVPDYLTEVQFGGFYGWPWYYWGGAPDTRPKDPDDQDLQQYVVRPDYALGPHTASLGLTFSDGAKLGPAFTGGAFIGQHGSWNRKPFSGYKVIFVRFQKGRPVGLPVDVLSGFLNADEQARGRPVGVVVDRAGGLLVADDVGNAVWRVSAK